VGTLGIRNNQRSGYAPNANRHIGIEKRLESNMSYTVIKMIKGHPYLYLVRGERRGSRTIQVYEKYLGRADKFVESGENMINASEVKELLEQKALRAQELNQSDADWQTLRSEIYNRDNGMCWICNKFVELQDYELGHLVDRCNGGQDIYENLAVMHKGCNNSKPKHYTLEEAIVWKLRTRYLATERPTALFGNPPEPKTYSYPKVKKQPKTRVKRTPKPTPQDIPRTIPQAIAGDNELKMEALRLLGQILDTPTKQPTPKRHYTSYNEYENRRPINYKRHHHNKPPKPTSPELLARITAGTLCWIQGRPQGPGDNENVPMWKVLPPPYHQDSIFTIRTTPPGATDNGGHNIRETLQVIGGALTQEVNIDMGHSHIHITPNGDTPSITLSSSKQSNNNTARNRTVGMGKGQIPLEEWYEAKAQGITFKDFVASYPQG